MKPSQKRRRSPKIPKIPKQKKKKVNIDQIQVPLTNKFSILSEEKNSGEASRTLKQKISPIVVTDIKANIQKIIADLNINVGTKIVSIGKKIFAKSADDKKLISDAFTEAKINYFSHPDIDKKVFKAVLSGLPEISPNVIIDNLNETYNLTTTKVIMFNTKSHSKLYLCHFDKKEVNMKTLNTIKVVYHHIVKWQPFKPKQNTPTQCYRCCMYGHGASNCKRYAICMLCSGEHLTKTCTVIKADDENPAYKCFNCASNNVPHNHKASDTNCPFRAKYEAARTGARNKTTTPSKQNTVNASTQQTHRFVRAPPPAPLGVSFAAATAQTNTQSHTAGFSSSTSSSSTNNTHTTSNASGDLWSMTEISNILMNSINELKQCRSKLDQLAVISKLLQYACV